MKLIFKSCYIFQNNLKLHQCSVLVERGGEGHQLEKLRNKELACSVEVIFYWYS